MLDGLRQKLQHESSVNQRDASIGEASTEASKLEALERLGEISISFVPEDPTSTGDSLQRPTKWKKFFHSKGCSVLRRLETKRPSMLYCQSSVPTIYIPSLKMAYIKTPKAASTAFCSFFKTQFPDAVEGFLDSMDIPDNVFVFTFVREPMSQKLAAYAEIDVIYQENLYPKQPNETNCTFPFVDRERNGGRSRFQAFLYDLQENRFGKGSRENWRPMHGRSQISSVICATRRPFDFIGHVEHLEADWKAVQRKAKVPKQLRTKAIPVTHSDNADKFVHYWQDEHIALTHHEEKLVCETFPSDFACLGYEVPPACQKSFLRHELNREALDDDNLPNGWISSRHHKNISWHHA